MEKSSEKPSLKIIDHPDKSVNWNMQTIDLGWAKITIESQEHKMTLANSIYILEATKLCLMGIPFGD